MFLFISSYKISRSRWLHLMRAKCLKTIFLAQAVGSRWLAAIRFVSIFFGADLHGLPLKSTKLSNFHKLQITTLQFFEVKNNGKKARSAFQLPSQFWLSAPVWLWKKFCSTWERKRKPCSLRKRAHKRAKLHRSASALILLKSSKTGRKSLLKAVLMRQL